MTTTTLAFIPSPAQGVWHIGSFPLRAYALCIIIGIIAALVIGDRRWEARGGERGVIYDIALWAVPFGLVGGRLYHVMTDWRTYFGEGGAGLGAALRIWDGGLGIWGAVALGAVGAWIGCRHRGIPLPAFGDAIAPGIVLAQAIGRLGNYFNQELYGRPTTLPWGLEIYERRNANGAIDTLNGVSNGHLLGVVHPTFLYELLWNLVVFALLIWLDRRFRIGHGRLFALYVAAYCVGRFCVELMRSDMATHIAGIRINSFTSTFVFIGAVVYIMAAPKGRDDPASLRGKPEAEDSDESATEVLSKDVAAVAATTGVVAAAKVAGDSDDEDAAAVGDVTDADGDASADESEEPIHGDEMTVDVADESVESVDVDDAEEPDVGLGLVEGEEAVEAEDAADEVHATAEGDEAEAEELADEVAEESETEESETEESETVDSAEDSESVEAGETEESATDDAEEDAEQGTDETEVADDADEDADTAEPEAEPEAGLGAVEGDEAVEAEDAAEEVHATAVADEAEADELADEVADEEAGVESGESAEDEPSDEEDEEPEFEESEEEPESAVDAEEDVEGAEPGSGLGAVEGDEVVEAEDAAEEVHATAVADEAEADELADEVAEAGDDEDAETSEQPDDESAEEPEGDEQAAEPDEPDEPEDDATPKEAEAPKQPDATQTASAGRPRWWQRLRR